MKIVALDYGEKFIGIAVCEPVFMTVHPRKALARTVLARDIEYILTLLENESADLLVVGLPLNQCGEETETSARVRTFVRNLEKKMAYSTRGYRKVPVEFWDERYTTMDADLILEESGVPKSERKKDIDSLSAVLILEDYIGSKGLVGSNK